MKYLLLVFLIFPTKSWASQSLELIKDKLINEEEKIKDIYYEEGNDIWMVGVFNDGQKRFGYAEYICSILADEYKAVKETTSVRIVDIIKVKNGVAPREASLGRVHCKSFEHIAP